MKNTVSQKEFISRYCPVRPCFGEILMMTAWFSIFTFALYKGITQIEGVFAAVLCFLPFLYGILICIFSIYQFRNNRNYLERVVHSGELNHIIRDLESAEPYLNNHLMLGQRYAFLNRNQPFRYSQILHVLYKARQFEDDYPSIKFNLRSNENAFCVINDYSPQEFEELIHQLERRGAVLTWEYRE